MDRQLFNEYPEDKRKEMLDSNSDGIEELDYTVILSDEEIIEKKDRLAIRSIEESRILDEKKEVVDEFKERLKPITTEKVQLLEDIKHGSYATNGICYKIIEGDRVGYYSPQGLLVLERAARPDERQLTISHALREGTNDK